MIAKPPYSRHNDAVSRFELAPELRGGGGGKPKQQRKHLKAKSPAALLGHLKVGI